MLIGGLFFLRNCGIVIQNVILSNHHLDMPIRPQTNSSKKSKEFKRRDPSMGGVKPIQFHTHLLNKLKEPSFHLEWVNCRINLVFHAHGLE